MKSVQWSADGHYYRFVSQTERGEWTPIDPAFPPFEGVPSNIVEEVADDDPRFGAAVGPKPRRRRT